MMVRRRPAGDIMPVRPVVMPDRIVLQEGDLGIRDMFHRARLTRASRMTSRSSKHIEAQAEDRPGSEATTLSSSSTNDLFTSAGSRTTGVNDLTWDDFEEDSQGDSDSDIMGYVGLSLRDWVPRHLSSHLLMSGASDDTYFVTEDVFLDQRVEPGIAADESAPGASLHASAEPTASYLTPEVSEAQSVVIRAQSQSQAASRTGTPSRIPVPVTPSQQRQSGCLQQKTPVDYRGLHYRGRRGRQ